MNEWNWTVFVFCALFTFAYALFTPVMAAFVVSGSGFGFGVGYFYSEGAVRRAQRRAAGADQKKKRRGFKGNPKRIFSSLRKHVRLERIFLTGVLSFENAMVTALAYGAICALEKTNPLRIKNGVSVDFVSGRTQMELTGILSVPLGHIILAAVQEAAFSGKEKIRKWKNTRLRA